MSKSFEDPASMNMYEMLFADQPDLFSKSMHPPYPSPWDVLFSSTPEVQKLNKLTEDDGAESRIRLLAAQRLRDSHDPPTKKILLGVIVEVGLDEGLDVLAAYQDGTVRYFNYSGRILIWENPTEESNRLVQNLFTESAKIVSQIGPWNEPRRPQPTRGSLRISFLMTDGLYFGEGLINTLFSDPMASPALMAATAIMQYVTQQSLNK